MYEVTWKNHILAIVVEGYSGDLREKEQHGRESDCDYAHLRKKREKTLPGGKSLKNSHEKVERSGNCEVRNREKAPYSHLIRAYSLLSERENPPGKSSGEMNESRLRATK